MLTRISIAADGFDAYDLEPAGFPDLLAERPLVAMGKWRGKPAGRIVLRGESGSGPWESVLDVAAAAPSPGNAALAHLWARARVAALGDFGLQGSAERNRPDILALGLKYTLLTPFTSFVAVHEVVRNPGGDGAERRPAAAAARGRHQLRGGDDPGLGAGAVLRPPRPRHPLPGPDAGPRRLRGAAVRPAVRENAPALAVSLALALATKAAFSRLGPDELRWMTWPTQALVGLAAGLDFTYEAGYGYVDLAHRLVIAKSCTGVNYLLAVFGLLVATLRARRGRARPGSWPRSRAWPRPRTP